jgi:hypothetical protein
LELEIQWGVKGVKMRTKKDKSQPGMNMNSLGVRFSIVMEKKSNEKD